MGLISVWIYCLLTLWSWNFALGCTWMQSRDKGSQSNFKGASAHSIRMLEQMAKERVVFIHDTINDIIKLYITGEYDVVTRDPDELENFQAVLHRQAFELEECAKERVVFIHDTINDIIKLYITGEYDVVTRDRDELENFQVVLHRQAFELEECAQERVVFIHDTINDIIKLYITGEYDAVTWDPNELENFQAVLHRQAFELEKCAQERVVFIHDTINDIIKLYITGEYDAVTWDPNELENFQAVLHRQAFELEKCAQERVVFIHKTINDIKKLYTTGKYDAVTWDQEKLEIFQLDLDRQASELKQCMGDKIKFLYESINQIIQLFNGNLDAVTWKRLKLEQFLTVLDRQSRELQKCVSSYIKGVQNVCNGCNCSDWIQHGFGPVSREYLSLLSDMGGDITNAKVPVPFPDVLYGRIRTAQMGDKITFLYESINQIIKLFHGNSNAVTWKRLKLEHFLTLLNRQSHELHKCVSPASKYEKRLNRYFRELNKNVLKKGNYDSHSWELIRKAADRHLKRLDLISASIKEQMNKVN
ncbi:hypothetical protein AAFF_G00340940 [Aldrovandia affinis]|uniref:Uncharacterized protein n=1 Tax=Aldrovandia affinis TaxID=143900 RepID=A0AAD7WP73_9TELE|nr:hypothetical protein AAFF_G00340940 [Aldrovandia affinis]